MVQSPVHVRKFPSRLEADASVKASEYSYGHLLAKTICNGLQMGLYFRGANKTIVVLGYIVLNSIRPAIRPLGLLTIQDIQGSGCRNFPHR